MWTQQFHRSYSMQDNQYFNVLNLNYWTPENTSGTWVRPGVPSGPMEVLYYQKVSYVKVGYINLGYSLPKQAISKMGLSKFRVFASCQKPLHLYRLCRLGSGNGKPGHIRPRLSHDP